MILFKYTKNNIKHEVNRRYFTNEEINILLIHKKNNSIAK